MSVQSLGEFWTKFDADENLRRDFFASVPAKIPDGTPIVEFAKRHGYSFTEAELGQAGELVAQKTTGQGSEEVAGYLYRRDALSAKILGNIGKRPGRIGDIMV